MFQVTQRMVEHECIGDGMAWFAEQGASNISSSQLSEGVQSVSTDVLRKTVHRR